MKLPNSVEERFWRSVDKHGKNGCWIWLKCRDRGGYGQFCINEKLNGKIIRSKKYLAHRFSYELLIDKLPKKESWIVIDHICRNRACVNPSHMRVVPQAKNVRSGMKSKLKESDIPKIFGMRAQGIPQKDVAKIFGISQSMISSIIHGRYWNNLSL